MTLFRKAVKIVNLYLAYIPFLALSGLFILPEPTHYCVLLSIVLYFILYPIVYGSIVEKIQNVTESTWTILLARHIFDYFVLSLLSVISALTIKLLLSGLDFLTNALRTELIRLSFQCMTLYIWPLLFIKQRIFRSIYDGFAFLMHDPHKSAIMLLLIVFSFALNIIAKAIVAIISPQSNILLIYGIGYLYNMISGYVGLVVFSMATMLLLKDETTKAQVGILQET